MDDETIISKLGGTTRVAELCEVSPQAVSQWFGVDPETGAARRIPKSRLMYLRAIRPDVFVGSGVGKGELLIPLKAAA